LHRRRTFEHHKRPAQARPRAYPARHPRCALESDSKQKSRALRRGSSGEHHERKTQWRTRRRSGPLPAPTG
jgi:hypothetical protein